MLFNVGDTISNADGDPITITEVRPCAGGLFWRGYFDTTGAIGTGVFVEDTPPKDTEPTRGWCGVPNAGLWRVYDTDGNAFACVGLYVYSRSELTFEAHERVMLEARENVRLGRV